MTYRVLAADTSLLAEGYDEDVDAFNVAAQSIKDSSTKVAVVVDDNSGDAVLILHNGFAYLADAAPPVE